ncbi:M1-specific T cell receptor beta chain-like [Acipenser oxyrinchus oxyrinchus]|nr:M1-specific T cell receptor beta chain-like [Acipenser oxyrinchus oxyrinchus]
MSPFAGFSIAVNVTQTPSIFLLSRTGEPAVLHCVHDAADHNYLYWYRQVRDGGLTLIAYSLNKDDEQYEAGFESSFTIHRPEVKRSSFEIKSVKSEDTAAVFSQLLNNVNNYDPAHFGKGTKLTVLGKKTDISEPKLHILEPSKEETVEKKRVTLVCLATDFYPDHIEITWKINGKNRSNGVKTDDYATNNTKTYSISSRLRLTPREWFNPENTFTCAAKFYKGNGSETVIHEKHISGKDGRFIKTFCKSVCH